ncbi:MAG: Lrp/AsnC family transcriptional regulator [Nitrososphaeria archaeon]|nr:Lrp/AsnC family transcriptional regulator [Nitrososphaeria archaeon]
MKIEGLDERLIDLLKVNARMSVRDLARILKVSPATVSKKIKRLEMSGLIKGYVTILDESRLGYGCRLMLLIRTNGVSNVRLLAEQIAELKESCITLLSAGSYDIVTVLTCKTQEDASHMIETIRKMGGIERIDSLLITERLKLLNKKLYSSSEEEKLKNSPPIDNG